MVRGQSFEDYCAEDHHDTEVFEKRMLFFSADVHYDLARVFVHREESGSLASLSKRGPRSTSRRFPWCPDAPLGREFPGLNKFPITGPPHGGLFSARLFFPRILP
jgi:hypothetical protein